MISIRRATTADQQALGRFGGALMRQHHDADPRRFIQVEHPEAGYGRFLVSQLSNPESVVLVAERAGEVVGYVWADVEGISWKDLRGPCGFVHDIYVDEAAGRVPGASCCTARWSGSAPRVARRSCCGRRRGTTTRGTCSRGWASAPR
jgi:hypothetical protein